MILGVDGCKSGWVAVALDPDGRIAETLTAPSLEDLFDRLPGVSVAGVDMPLHLLDAPRRPADDLAREAVRTDRGRSVFHSLPRFTIEPEWIEAGFDAINAECRARFGIAFSKQSIALRDKIAEVNAAFTAGLPVIEVHPELSFTAMNGGTPMTFAKKCWGGQRERLALLESAGLLLPGDLPNAVARLAPDDLIDAAAAAWSAGRYQRGEARSYPSGGTDPREPKIWA